jgi:S-(hydroxymethyl)mycothiol dehydrogenase
MCIGEGQMPSEIRAAVCHEFGSPLSVETVILRDPGPGEVEVTLEAVAICHSDISYIEGGWGGPLPSVYGHEAAGRVTAVGAGVTSVAEGQRVIVTLIRSCGTCPSCVTARPVHCMGNQPLPPELSFPDGREVNKGLKCGAFAEKVVVHASQVAFVGDDVPAESACLLACGVPTGLGAAVNTARVRPGETVAVIGLGGVGLNAVQGARLAGAGRIMSSSRWASFPPMTSRRNFWRAAAPSTRSVCRITARPPPWRPT